MLQRGELGFAPGHGFLETVHAGGGPLEFALGLLNLPIDRREIPGEIVAVKG